MLCINSDLYLHWKWSNSWGRGGQTKRDTLTECSIKIPLQFISYFYLVWELFWLYIFNLGKFKTKHSIFNLNLYIHSSIWSLVYIQTFIFKKDVNVIYTKSLECDKVYVSVYLSVFVLTNQIPAWHDVINCWSLIGQNNGTLRPPAIIMGTAI